MRQKLQSCGREAQNCILTQCLWLNKDLRYISCTDLIPKEEATILYIAILDTYGHEELVYNTIKNSLGTVYDNLKPLKFFPGALRHIYYAVTHEFQRPNAVMINNRTALFLAQDTYKIDGNSDPRTTIKSIEQEANILNNLHPSVNINDNQKLITLRNAAFNNSLYTQAIKILEGNGMPNFEDLKGVIQNEYLNYVKEQPAASGEEAHIASEDSQSHNRDHKSGDVTPEARYDEHANWVDVPKGVCYPFAIKGKCDRETCDFKHVRIEPSIRGNGGRNTHPSHNSRESKDRRFFLKKKKRGTNLIK